jgi:hypothetical protein
LTFFLGHAEFDARNALAFDDLRLAGGRQQQARERR